MYNDVVNVLSQAAKHSFCKVNVRRHKCIKGWNKHVSEAHKQARLHYEVYILCGRPNSGPVYENMRLSRKIFKSRLKYCIRHQEQIQLDIIAYQHATKQFGKFWKCTKKLNGKTDLPVSVEGFSEPKHIANIFKDYFKVCSPVPAVSPDASVVRGAESSHRGDSLRITSKDVNEAIRNMKRGKSPGHDGLSIEHLQHGGSHISRVLSMFFTFCLRHSYLPSSLMKTIVVSLIKNSTGDISDKTNYRPISLATIIAKVLDRVVDSHLSSYITLPDSQFGFREGLSTESAILSLKYTVNYYTKRSTPIYACFLDLSKAFDLVSYDILWDKLNDTGVSPEVVKLLSYWYKGQTNFVKWANIFSDEYSLNCGVRQGGLTSPRLFNLYVNQLIGELSSMHVGCRIDDVCVNNISYADDMVLLSPSISGLREMLKMCEAYAVKHGLKYNEKKSEFMVFGTARSTPKLIPPLLLNGVPLKRVTQFKYLGHIVTENLKDDLDIERERRALAVRGNMLVHRFARCTAEVKRTLYKAFCQSFYTSGLWTNFTQRAYNALRVQYNNIFRALLGLPRYCSASGMFADANVDCFHTIMRKKTASVVLHMRGSANGILRMIAERMDSSVLGRFTELHVVRCAVR